MLESKWRQARHASYVPAQGGVWASLSVAREATLGSDLYHTHVVHHTSS